MTINELVFKYPQFRFLKQSRKIAALSPEQQEFIAGLLEDSMFWIELEEKPNSNDGFKFLAATYGLHNAHSEAETQGLEGKDREKFLRPHQDLYTMFNPYSGNGHEAE